MKALSELEMASVSGQGVMTNYERLLDIVDSDLKSDEDVAATTLESLASSLIPGTNLLDSDVEISGVEYEPGPRTTINADGSLDIQLPTNIKQIAFRNVRVAGSEGQHMGDVIVRDLAFGAGSSGKIHLRCVFFPPIKKRRISRRFLWLADADSVVTNRQWHESDDGQGNAHAHQWQQDFFMAVPEALANGFFFRQPYFFFSHHLPGQQMVQRHRRA